MTTIDRVCKACRHPMVRWRETWLCLNCDNRPDSTQAGWALDWARSITEGPA